MKEGSSKDAPAKEAARPAQVAIAPADLAARLREIHKSTKIRAIQRLIKPVESGEYSIGHLNNALMDAYRSHSSAEAYSLLYELNYRIFFLIIFSKIKSYSNLLDPKDILQDVFLSIFRYPKRFRSEKETAFRNWSYSIIRNTILKHLKLREKAGISTDLLPEILEDKGAYSPLSLLTERENVQRFKKFYLFYLMLYIHVFNNYLSERARQALLYVEVEGKRYREASEHLGIKLENFKMVVCRARKKIHRTMNQILGHAGS